MPMPPTGAGDPSNALPSKEELRRRFRRRRREGLAEAADGILAVAQQHLPPRLEAGRRLGLWWPIGAEPDLRPLAALLEHQQPGRLALPAVHAYPPANPALRLLYLPWRPGDPLAPDACGISSPPAPASGEAPLAPHQMALLLVPALAIDRSGIRLGSGGGWYDRLRADPHWRTVPALAVLPAACVSPTPLPRDPWDVPFVGWLDESGWHLASPPPDPAAAGDFVASS